MGSTRSISTKWMTVSANTASPGDNGFVSATAYMRAGVLDRVRMSIETRNRIGNIELIGAVNFANNKFSPTSTVNKIGSAWIDFTGVTPQVRLKT